MSNHTHYIYRERSTFTTNYSLISNLFSKANQLVDLWRITQAGDIHDALVKFTDRVTIGVATNVMGHMKNELSNLLKGKITYNCLDGRPNWQGLIKILEIIYFLCYILTFSDLFKAMVIRLRRRFPQIILRKRLDMS